MNKQKDTKRTPAYLTGLVNMIIEDNIGNNHCDYNPRKLTTLTKNNYPVRTFARRVDGASSPRYQGGRWYQLYRSVRVSRWDFIKVSRGTETETEVAIVTHKGAAADAGHYMAYVKKSVFHPVSRTAGSDNKEGATLDEDDEDWYKFDDQKVSIFPKEKLTTLDGGGEDSSAYVLLYKSKPLA